MFVSKVIQSQNDTKTDVVNSLIVSPIEYIDYKKIDNGQKIGLPTYSFSTTLPKGADRKNENGGLKVKQGVSFY